MASMPQDPIEGTKHFARFTLSNGEAVDGEFLLDGSQTCVILHTDRHPSGRSGDFSTLHADLPAGRWLSFLKCVRLGGETSHSGAGRQINRIRLYPHYAVLGTHVFSPHERISRLGFVPDDFAAVYYDFDAFGYDLAPEEHIGHILESFQSRIGRRVEPGDRPVITYFVGRRQLFSATAPFGRVSARHQAGDPILGGGPRGVSINNVVMTNLDFVPSATFDQAIENLNAVLRFLEVVAGRRQNLAHVEIELDVPESCQRSVLKVYISSPPNRLVVTDEREPHPADLLLNGGIRPTQFAAVLERWLAVDHERADARVQFSDGFSNGNQYDVRRLVSSANMFDILPASAVPKCVELSKELRKAQAEARRIFEALPQSFERDRALGDLGRLGVTNLKHKARHRGQLVLTEAGERFPDLPLVLEQAVNCRNHYVHGTSSKINYRSRLFETVAFFTQTLEFVFAASDFVEAGWSITDWLSQGTTGSHPFGTYCSYYKDNLRALNAVLDAAASEAPAL
jgi:hypothetical protein